MSNTEKKAIIAILVENNSGVLTRISLMFEQRGINIETITACETNDPGITRITISTHGDEIEINRIVLLTQKLVEVLNVEVLDLSNCIEREMLLAKLEVSVSQRSEIKEICEIYKAQIVDMTPSSMVLALTAKPSTIDAILVVLGSYKIIELCRSGATVMERGENPLKYELKERHLF